MPGSRISDKGQVTIPVAIRRALGLKAGDRLHFKLRNGHVEMIKGSEKRHPQSLRGSVDAYRPSGVCVSLEDMQNAIEGSAVK